MAKKGKKHKKKKDKKGRDIKDDESVESVKSDTSIGGGGIVQHFEEPFFILSIFAFIIAIARPFFGIGWIAECLVLILFILGFLSIYFIYLYSKSEETKDWFLPALSVIFILAIINWFLFSKDIAFILGFLAIFFTYIYFKSEKKNYQFFMVPILIFFTALFAWWAYERLSKLDPDFFGARDFSTFSIFFGISTLFYVLWMHKILKLCSAAISVLFLSTLIIHLTPAFTPSYAHWSGKYLAALDPYYYYRHAKTIVETGYVPERETLIYPTSPPDFSESSFMVSVLMGSLSTILTQFGISVHDVAMLYPGVFSAFTIILFYLLLRDLFWDMRSYNYATALLGAFMLMLNPSFAAKAIATNCEDDTLGMFLLVSSFLLFVISFRRKSIILSLLAGFSFLLLKMSWAGYAYAITVFGIFGVFYAIINFIHKKNCVEHIPYFVIPMLMSLLYPLILHARGDIPRFVMPSQLFLFPFGGVLLVSFFLEMIRNYMSGKIEIKERRMGDRLENLIQRYVFPIGIALLLVTAYYLFIVIGPNSVINYALKLVKGAKQREIIGMTTAEQRELCSSFNLECLKGPLMNHFGLGMIFGVGMIPVLIYFIFFKRSLGATFVLTWSLPMIYGVIQKSQYQFTASVPIVALGSTIGLIIAMNKKDIQGLRVIPTIILLFTPILMLFLHGGVPFFGPFGGPSPMYMGASRDRIFWQGTLEWLRKQPSDIIVLTWWDYGHWIAAVSNRTSILDNTKADRFMVQDIAKFHVLVENETEALEIAKKYGATHVVIDWTMIGKSGAPHFISTSGLGGNIPFKSTGVKIKCINGNGCDNLIENKRGDYAYTYINQNGSIVIDFGGEYVINKTEIHLWDSDSRYYRYRIEVSTDGVNWKEVVDKTKGEFRGLQIDSFKDVKARFVRITGTYASIGNEFRVVNVRIYNPRYEGSYMGYGQCMILKENECNFYGRDNPFCQLLLSKRNLKPQLIQNADGGFDMVSRVVFDCNIGLGLIFEIRNGQYSPSNVYVVTPNGKFPWQTWRDRTGASILGVQSFKDILYGALHDPELPRDSIFKFDTFRSLIYVPNMVDPNTGERYNFNKVMMTKLYLGDHLEEYQNAGLADPTIEKPKYFKLVDGFLGDPRNPEDDHSYWGYVRVYKIIYPETENSKK
ncbi:MAG: hypothetical protein DRO76_01780 [Candidatus Altiarchaeales archaeon]|nr:MAG: hypothetical protein DRO76_01780 [Candidatus Altiarchaeales archaeon]